MHSVPERSPRGNTSELLNQWDPSRCTEVCKRRTTQHGVSSRWGPRAPERHAAALQGLEALTVLRWGWRGAHTHESPLQRMGRGKETMALES